MFSTIGYYICIPFAWLLRFFYNLTGSYGVAIIFFTLALKLILFPFQIKSKKSMLRVNRMSGKMEEIKKKYGNNQAKMGEEMQKLYAAEGVSPMSGCLWSFLPLPILIALYSIIRQPVTHFMMLKETVMMDLIDKISIAGADMSAIYTMEGGITQMQPYGQIALVRIINSQFPEIAANTEGWISMNYRFLGMDLTQMPFDMVKNFVFSAASIGVILIPILAGAFQLVMSVYSLKTQAQNNPNANSMKSMMYMMPLISVYFAFIMPAALGVYWIAQSVFSLIQEVLMTKFINKKIEEEENAKYEAIVADRRRRQEEAKRLQQERAQQPVQKMTLKEKQKAAQEAKIAKAAKAGGKTTEAGRMGNRPYARGRAYQQDRYDD